MYDRPVDDLSFDEASAELALIQPEATRLTGRANDLKARIRATYTAQPDLRHEKKSYYDDRPELGVSVRVTEPDPVFTLDPARLRALIDDDEIFLRVIQIAKVQLDVDAWLQAKREELVHDGMLEEASSESHPTPTVSVTKLTKASRKPEALPTYTAADVAAHYSTHPEAQRLMLHDQGWNLESGPPDGFIASPPDADTTDEYGLESFE